MIKIEFIPKYRSFEKIFPSPIPIQSHIPEWWKRQESYLNNDNNVYSGNMLLTVKKCQAIFDALSFGYYLLCPTDLYIDATEDILKFEVTNDVMEFQKFLLAHHLKEQIKEYPIPAYFHQGVLRIHPMWLVKTPEGYSSLFISPIHGDKSPIQAIPGLVDTDKYPSDGYLSFFVEKGFKGIIKQGTPIVQVIPFKREDWESSLNQDKKSDEKNRANQLSVRSVFQNGYRKKMWSKKTFK
jgi:hypothetical protein